METEARLKRLEKKLGQTVSQKHPKVNMFVMVILQRFTFVVSFSVDV